MTTNPSELKCSAEEFARHSQKFLQEYQSDLDSLMAIYHAEGIDPSRCRCCGSSHIELRNRHRLMKCHSCGAATWLTAGTFFEDMRKPLLWWAAVWLKQKGILFNAHRLSKLVGVSYSSAWYVFIRLDLINLNRMPATIHASSSRFTALISKRSRLTPAGQNPKSEESVTSKSRAKSDGTHSLDFHAAAFIKGNDTPDPDNSMELNLLSTIHSEKSTQHDGSVVGTLDTLQLEVYNLLSDSPLGTDTICAQSDKPISSVLSSLSLMEIDGLVQRLPGDRYIRTRMHKQTRLTDETDDVSEETLATIECVINFVRSTFKGVSRKYLQAYIANCWFYCATYNTKQQELMQVCSAFGRIKKQEILDFITPQVVQLFQFQK